MYFVLFRGPGPLRQSSVSHQSVTFDPAGPALLDYDGTDTPFTETGAICALFRFTGSSLDMF